MNAIFRSALTMALGASALILPFACGDDTSDGASATSGDDDGAADDDSGDDDGATDDDSGDDDGTTDDDSGDDDDNTSTFETDAGTFDVEFSGAGETCGDTTCKNGTLYQNGDSLITLSGCCADEGDETCGLNFSIAGRLFGLKDPGCEALDLPGSADPSCEMSPPLEIAFDQLNGVVLEGCCQATGQCGYSASFEGFGFGCVSPTRFGHDEGSDCDYEP